jgi:hypothetical protein
MKTQTYKNLNTISKQTNISKCKLIRKRLFPRSESGFSIYQKFTINFNTQWIQRHISMCPRCQKRFSAIAKVNLGLSLLKSQTHTLDLLKKANSCTVSVLKHSLRNSNRAAKLKSVIPRPTLFNRISAYRHSITQTAACIGILFLSKAGIFSSIEKPQDQGQKIVRNYYNNHLGNDLTNDIFGS